MPSDSTARGSRPNVVVVNADDMGYGDVGCYNPDSQIPTPNIDRLAEEGVRFTDAHSPSAVCTPSRYGLLTGRDPWRTRLRNGGVIFDYDDPLIDADRLTVGEMLQREGYATACCGKWHLGMEWPRHEGVPDAEEGFSNEAVDFTRPIEEGPTERGFDYFFGIRASLDMPPYCFIENDHTVGVPTVEKDPYNDQQREGPMVPGWRDEEVGPRVTEQAVNFVTDHVTHNPDDPFFLYVPTSAPHRPCTPPEFLEGASDAGPRGDMVAEVDWTVGQIDAALEALGVRENTLFVVTSDNGARATCHDGNDYGHRSNGDLRGKKADVWDGGHREPFVARWPAAIEGGRTCDETICHTDLLATVAALAGTSVPADAGEDSYDVTPALLGEDYDGPIREATVHQSGGGYLAVRQGPWKMVPSLGSGGFSEPRYPDPEPDGPEGQLYNLDDDPREQENLWQERPDVVDRLRDLFDRYDEAGRSAPVER
jgi:arylsulfatase A-like enzyme